MNKIEKMQKISLIIFPILLCFYFFGTFVSNIVTLAGPLQSFFTAGLTKYLWRGLVALIYGVYIVFVSIIFKIKFNRKLLIISGFVLFIVLISPLFNLTPLTTSYIDQWNREVTVSVNIGLIEILGYYANLFFSFLFMFSLFFVLPTLFKKSDKPFIVFYFFVAIMILACFFSYATEFSKYLHPQQSAYQDDIRSLFPSKNAFGSFLLHALMISIYMIFIGGMNFKSKFEGRNKKWWLVIWIFLATMFFATLVFTMNKNSIGAALVFGFFIPLLVLYRKNRSFKFKTILLSVYAGVLVTGILAISIVPSLRNMASSFLSSVDGRSELSHLFFQNLDGAQIFVGFGHTLSWRFYLWSNEIGRYIILNNIHNAFYTILGEGGMLYLAFYVGLIIYNFVILFKRREKNNASMIALAILISFVFSSFFESTALYITGSSGSALISILIVSIPLSLDETKEVK
jgi:hypothetical protein